MRFRKIIVIASSSSSSFQEKRTMVLKTFVLPVLVLFVRRRFSRSKTPHLSREYLTTFIIKYIFVVILKNESTFFVIPSNSEKEPFLQQKKRMLIEKGEEKSQNFFKSISSFSALFLSLSLHYTIFLSLDSAFEEEALSSKARCRSLYGVFLAQKREREYSFFFDRNEIHLPFGMKDDDTYAL